MGEAQQAVRRQQKTEELCGAAIRALSGKADLRYRGGRLLRGDSAIAVRVPHLQLELADSFAAFRGVADGIAMRLLLSDDALFRSQCPDDPLPCMLFDLLEQLRVEAQVPAHLPGLRQNLKRRFIDWSHRFHTARLTDSYTGVLLYTLTQMSWSRLNGWPVVEETEDFIEHTRAGLAPRVGTHLAGLRRHVADQAAYAEHALAIAEIVTAMIHSARDSVGENEDETTRADRSAFDLQRYEEAETDLAAIPSAATGRSKRLDDDRQAYRVFSTQYDREVQAASLVRPALLQELRQDLDRLIRAQGANIPRLARRLAAMLSTPVREGWRFGEEEGYVDGRRLHQLVTSTSERRVFRRERYVPQADSFVSVLIDCSGSMKEHIQRIAVLVDVLGRALQLAGVPTEILGFTTGGWNGGRVYQDWLRQGRPKNPGRLNEVCHLVYKDADTPWRRARPNVAALLKPDLFREGVDGEALLWASRRMLGRTEQRRVLLVVSDGSPMDTATKLANDGFYLDNHLQAVVSELRRRHGVEVYGLGVGLDLRPYYERCIELDLSAGISNRVFDEFIGMIARP